MRTTPFAASVEQIEFSLASQVESNADLLVENPEWDLRRIFEKTGVAQRYRAGSDETAGDLCVRAAERLFAAGRVARDQIDAVLFCTQSPDYLVPTTACLIQHRLGLPRRVAALDFNLGCSGYVYGLALAGSLVEAGVSQTILLLCGETYTKYIDPHDRTCRPIFSDAGTATLVRASQERLLGPFELGTDGQGAHDLIVPNSAARRSHASDPPGRLHMEGSSVLMFTMAAVPENVKQLTQRAGVPLTEVDWFVFHQASRLVLDELVARLQLPADKVVYDLEEIGNTVSATIPITLRRMAEARRLQPGQLVMLVGFGVGYSWGSCLLRWA